MAIAELPKEKKRQYLFAEDEVIYPESDGMPMAESTTQYHYLTTIKGNAEILFADDPDVFVAGDLFWYPVEGNNAIRTAPDVMLVFGRPKGERRSYQQWREENIAPQVVFEILSVGNRPTEMEEKFNFFERFGVEEYYLYDPEHGSLQGWMRTGHRLLKIPEMVGWRSPRMGVRFDMEDKALRLYYPDESPFLSIQEIHKKREEAEIHAHAATLARLDAEEQARVAEEQAHTAEEQARVAKEQARIAEEQAHAAKEQAQMESQARSAAEAKLTDAQAYIRELEEKLRQSRTE